MKETLDYKAVNPDLSVIEVYREGVRAEHIGTFKFDKEKHHYTFANITQNELIQILDSFKRLNKKVILPKWIQWKKN